MPGVQRDAWNSNPSTKTLEVWRMPYYLSVPEFTRPDSNGYTEVYSLGGSHYLTGRVELTELEPVAVSLQGTCSGQLELRPQCVESDLNRRRQLGRLTCCPYTIDA